MSASSSTVRKVDAAVTLEKSEDATIYNISVTLANTEISQALTTGTKRLAIRARTGAKIQFSFNATESSTNYYTIPEGNEWDEEELNLNGKTIYLQCNKVPTVVEILEWT